MEFLPSQIIEEILVAPSVSIRDTLNIAETCCRFQEVVCSSNYIWKHKFRMKWPQFVKLFSDDFNDWFAEVRYIFELSHRTHIMLSEMPSQFHKRRVLSDVHLKEWASLIEESQRAYEYLVFDLITIIENCAPITNISVVSVDTPGNKTLQYYATKVLRFIRQLHLAKEWNKFTALPKCEQTLEHGATFVAQWFQPSLQIEWENIENELNNLAEEVKNHLKIINSNHPLHKVPLETLQKWKKQNLEINQWNTTESQQIMEALSFIFYEKHKFYGENNLCLLPRNSFINEVFKRRCGRPVTLCIIYEGTARRLGLKYEHISFSNYFLLKFTESSSVYSQDYYYIDVFMKGQVISKGSCPYRHNLGDIPDDHLVPISARKVVEYFAHDLKTYYQQYTHTDESTYLRASLEFLHLIMPLDISTIINLARIYITQNVDTSPLINHLVKHAHEFAGLEQVCRTIIHKLQGHYELHKDHFRKTVTHIIPKNRPSNLKYGVGMVMKHRRMNYTCVIHDWDAVCTATNEWQMEAGVHKLRYKDQQPFYKVLAEGNLHRYVAQENIVPTVNPNLLDLNEDLGRHFSHFFETHYVPNAEKEAEFLEDVPVRHMFHNQLKFSVD